MIIITTVQNAGGELSLSSTGGLLARGLPPELVPRVRAARSASVAELECQRDAEWLRVQQWAQAEVARLRALPVTDPWSAVRAGIWPNPAVPGERLP